MEWYYSLDGVSQHGPVSTAELKDIVRGDNFGADGRVWKEGMPDWVAIEEIFPAEKKIATGGPPPLPPIDAEPPVLATPSTPIPAQHNPFVSPGNPFATPDDIDDSPNKSRKKRKLKASEETRDLAEDTMKWVSAAFIMTALNWLPHIAMHFLTVSKIQMPTVLAKAFLLGFALVVALVFAVPMFQLARFYFSLDEFVQEPTADNIAQTVHQSYLFWKLTILIPTIIIAINFLFYIFS